MKFPDILDENTAPANKTNIGNKKRKSFRFYWQSLILRAWHFSGEMFNILGLSPENSIYSLLQIRRQKDVVKKALD